MHSVTDRQTDGQTDGQQDDANSRSYCVAVRSAKNLMLRTKVTPSSENNDIIVCLFSFTFSVVHRFIDFYSASA